jgi:hypothetical protein
MREHRWLSISTSNSKQWNIPYHAWQEQLFCTYTSTRPPTCGSAFAQGGIQFCTLWCRLCLLHPYLHHSCNTSVMSLLTTVVVAQDINSWFGRTCKLTFSPSSPWPRPYHVIMRGTNTKSRGPLAINQSQNKGKLRLRGWPSLLVGQTNTTTRWPCCSQETPQCVTAQEPPKASCLLYMPYQ